MIRRIGIFGGSFDPVHIGHLIIASDVFDRLDLAAVHFVLAPRPPHKVGLWASDGDRASMLELAISPDPRFVLDLREFDRQGPSWSVDTVESFSAQFPGVELYFVMGEDSLAEFHTWRSPERILSLAHLAVASRPGAHVSSLDLSQFSDTERDRIHLIESPEVDISSTSIRDRIWSGRSVRYLVPEAVAEYITRQTPYERNPQLR